MTSAPSTWILVRGLARERAHWGPFPAQLEQALGGARVARVVSLDLPGAGALHGVRAPACVEALAESCHAQLRALRIDGPVNLVGLSLGGLVVVEWSRRWPGEVRAVVIVNSSARGLSPLHRRLRPSSWPALLRIALRWGTRDAEHEVLRLTSASAQRHAGVLGAWMAVRRERPVSRANALRQLLAAARYRVAPELGGVPILVVCSAADALVDPACSHALAVALGGTILVHPDAGHDLPLDAARWLAMAIADWVDGGTASMRPMKPGTHAMPPVDAEPGSDAT